MSADLIEAEPVILHVVSYDVSRGAERHARALVDVMDGRDGRRHLIMTMFQGDEESLHADVALDVPRGRMRRLGLDPRVVSRMRRRLRDLRPEVVVAHGGEPAKYVALADRDATFVYLVIGSSHPKLTSLWRRRMRDFYVDRSAAVVTVSAGLADEMRGSGVPASKLHVIPNGRDPAVYRPGRPEAGTPQVIFVGHLDDQKRPHLFISVIAELRRRGVVCRAAMVGGGPLLADVTRTGQAAGVEVLGPRDDVPSLLADSHVLLSTSRPPEGMPGVLIEAGMASLPAVTTDVPGAREVVVDGVTGLVVAVDDEAGLADSVETILRDRDLRDRMGDAARERCVAEFSLESAADRWTEVFERVRT